jgi:hypothetical protein
MANEVAPKRRMKRVRHRWRGPQTPPISSIVQYGTCCCVDFRSRHSLCQATGSLHSLNVQVQAPCAALCARSPATRGGLTTAALASCGLRYAKVQRFDEYPTGTKPALAGVALRAQLALLHRYGRVQAQCRELPRHLTRMLLRGQASKRL